MEKINLQESKKRIIIRISDESLSFAIPKTDSSNGISAYEQYPVNNSISMAANLREAFGTSELLSSGCNCALIMLDAPVMLTPIDEYQEEHEETFYTYTFPNSTPPFINCILPEQNAVAVFAINKDLKVVIDDHFSDVRYVPVSHPVWEHLYHRSFIGERGKLFAYFHDNKMEVFCFAKNRFKYFNTFETTHANDVLYYLLHIWNQLGLNAEEDELHIAGDIPNQEWLTNQLRRFLTRVFTIRQSIDPTQLQENKLQDIPYDLLTLLHK